MEITLVNLRNKVLSLDLAEGLNNLSFKTGSCIKVSAPSRAIKTNWHSGIAIVLAGHKKVELGNDILDMPNGYFSFTPFTLPVVSRVSEASPSDPYYCLILEVSFKMFLEVESWILDDESKDDPSGETLVHPFIVGQLNQKILGPIDRLISIIQDKEDAALGMHLSKEILYYVLKTEEGRRLRFFLRSSGKISNVISEIGQNLRKELSIDDIAKRLGLSRSVFYRRFKAATGLSPIQFQKKLRHLEAQRLMAFEDHSAQEASNRVGFNSPSQFNREYVRMFGLSPYKDAIRSKKDKS